MNISVIVLGAGKGTRMKSNNPKVLHKISGKSMISHVIDSVKDISDDIVVVLSHQAKRIEDELNREYNNLKFHIQDLENFPGTAGALRGISPRYEKVLILNGDMPLITKESIGKLIEKDGDINLSVLELENPKGYGRVVIENGEIREIVEEKDCSPTQRDIKSVNGGVYCLKREVLEEYIPRIDNSNAQKEYYLTDIIKLAVDDSRVVNPIFVDESEFKGVNSKYDLAVAEEIMQKRIKRELMESGVTMRLPDTIFIDINSQFEGEVTLESGVSILGDSKIVNSHIKSNSIVESSIVKDSEVGPMARVRPESNIIDSKIGNFVEVKKSTLNGVKAGHLSYLGDSTIDEGTNIGAGVITCNYDGKAKHKTIIGKNVFVGSDSQLVAPIIIEDSVMVGAGTTVTKNIKEGSLAISRVKLKVVKDFFYKFFGRG
ncbi:MAG: bifunctional UDP-N-acetylglucosamine diphosphorylase/glucosamine-1-phosphate N-acetyltransferase GlmU [Epsilonproteobacteria bacterium]|nr:bifunctional UDP-N-acetylglucosamine diphosphorylase/glucosamine-1-phosphate N-acetyltransferase GlmU [Campylobacterota bacterium]